jgi:pyrroline-5-carboxylate reductase
MTIDKRIGVIGLGAMGGAMSAGWVNSQVLRADQLVGFDVNPEACAAFPGTAVASVAKVFELSDVVVLAVKPQMVGAALADCGDAHVELLLSILAGTSIASLRSLNVPATHLVRAMPNTAALLRRSVTAYVAEKGAPLEIVEALLGAVGHVERLDREEQLHGATALVGSSPAFLYVLAEALADGGVAGGIPRATAQRMVAGVFAGVAAMLERDPAAAASLKDGVASPGGTTIAGLAALDAAGGRFAVIDALRAASERSEELA